MKKNLFLQWAPATGNTAGTSVGCTMTASGTVSHPALAATTLAATTLQTQMRRTRFASATSANAKAGLISSDTICWRGNAANLGGFTFSARFTLSTNVASSRAFIGLSASRSSVVAAEPNSFANSIGVGFDAADSGNWKLIRKDASTSTKVDLGSNAARNATDVYDLTISADPNGSQMSVSVTNVSTGAIILQNVPYSTNLPANTAFLYVHAEAGPAATGVSTQIELAALSLVLERSTLLADARHPTPTTVATIAQLQSLVGPFGAGDAVEVAGYHASNDGGGGTFFFEGTPAASATISNAQLSTKTVTNATWAAPIVITATGHGFVTGQAVCISPVTGNTAAEGTWLITKITNDTFSLDGSVGNGTFSGSATATSVTVTTSAAHGYATRSRVTLGGVEGMTGINGIPWRVGTGTATTFTIAANTTQGGGTYTSGTGLLADGGSSILSSNGKYRWLREFSDVYNVRAFGAKGDNATNDQPAFAAAVNAMPGLYGSTLWIPAGNYVLNDDWVIDRGLTIAGVARGVDGSFLIGGSRLFFGAGKSLRLMRADVTASITRIGIICTTLSPAAWQAWHSYAVGDLVYGTLGYAGQRNGYHYVCTVPGTSGGTTPTWSNANSSNATLTDNQVTWRAVSSPGIYVNGRLFVEDCYISTATDSGIHFEGSSGLGSNCNGSTARVVTIASCGGHGIYLRGNEAQGCVIENCTITGSGGFAIADQGQLSNVVLGNIAEDNAHAYLCDNGTQSSGKPSVWLGNYAEGNQGASVLMSPCTYVSGSDGAGFAAQTTATVVANGWCRNQAFDTGGVQLFLGNSIGTNPPYDILGFRQSPGPFVHALTWNSSAKAFQLTMPSLTNVTAFEIGDYQNHEGRNYMRFPNGFYLGAGTSRRRILMGSAQPAVSDSAPRLWKVGDRVYLDSPAAGGTEGWVCTTTGGWGGGFTYSTRTFTSGLTVFPGDGIEPASANGFVYRAIAMSGGAYALTTTTAPTWPTTIGNTGLSTGPGSHGSASAWWVRRSRRLEASQPSLCTCTASPRRA